MLAGINAYILHTCPNYPTLAPITPRNRCSLFGTLKTLSTKSNNYLLNKNSDGNNLIRVKFDPYGTDVTYL